MCRDREEGRKFWPLKKVANLLFRFRFQSGQHSSMSEPDEEIMSSVGKQLLPGIHDDITVTHVATKLPWTALHVLSSVSRDWQRAIQSREVYRERIRCHSTETLVVVKHQDFNDIVDSIFLYSMREKIFYRLPPIPQIEGRILDGTQFISVEGKLYVLGARSEEPYRFDIRGDIYFENHYKLNWERLQEPVPVYMLDLAGQRRWKECRNIQEPEREYTISMGGAFKRGNKHFVRGGSANWFRSFWQVRDYDVEKEWKEEVRDWRGAEPANPQYLTVEGEHYRVEDVENFIMQGKYYSIQRQDGGENQDVHVFDIETKSWTHQHSISWSTEVELEITAAVRRRRPGSLRIEPFFILPVNDELLALASWKRFHDDVCSHYVHGAGCWHYDEGYCLLQTKGFGSDRREIVWEKAPHSSDLRYVKGIHYAICPIQL